MRWIRRKMMSAATEIIRFTAAAVIITVGFFLAGNNPAYADFKESSHVIDQAGLLTEEEAAQYETEIVSMQERMRMNILVVTTDDAGGSSAREYAEDFYENYISDGTAAGGIYHNGGALFLIDMDNRELYIATAGAMIRYLTDSRYEAVLDAASEGASEGNYAACVEVFLSETNRYYEAGIPGGQYNYDAETGKISRYRSIRWYEVLIALSVAGAAAFSACVGAANRYAMKKERRQAGNYLMAYRADSSFVYTDSHDDLINKTVTHVIMPRNNGGHGSGGGSHSGRSTTHTSSSGRTYGGGGRKF